MTVVKHLISAWHKEYYSCRQCSSLDHHLSRLCAKLKRQMTKDDMVLDRYRKGSHSGVKEAAVTQGFLLHSEWIPHVRVVVEVVYCEAGVRLQLAAYAPTANVEDPPMDHSLVDDIPPLAVTLLDEMPLDWEKTATIHGMDERRVSVRFMLQNSEPMLSAAVSRFCDQLLELATP